MNAAMFIHPCHRLSAIDHAQAVFSGTVVRLADLLAYEDCELIAAKIAACFAAVIRERFYISPLERLARWARYQPQRLRNFIESIHQPGWEDD